ncbi:OmpA family protein [Flavobacterium sp. MMLR14_040]|uniref:OmpA family protein n=1 Tax=Flavobacterium sp. MMLR14_040 TaxID=3093843 RepID=UPI0029907B1E|nr:OmpA family protein [Flavobacterium sp. MMLR14_040]MDW8850996.1 OmpA family protein [Flavobacterium sp. MMLR14_040]
MKNFILFYITIFSFVALEGNAQQAKIKAANKDYDTFAYIDVIKTYEKVALKGYKSEDMFRKLGDSYYFNSEFEGAAKWYGELFAMNTNIESEYYYRYAQSLRATGQVDKADKMMAEFNAKFENDTRGKLYKENPNYLDLIKANSGRYNIEDAGINSKYSDYGTFVYNKKLYFTSARDTGNFSKRKHTWTGEHFTNLYIADVDSAKVKKFKTSLNSKFHDATPIFTKDGKTVYFTRNNYLNGKKGKNENKTTLVKLYKATLENDKWTNITALPFTSDNYSTAHPALSPDEKTLYFSSDMPGTLGQSDIFRVAINDNGGGYGTPQNLGPTINTEGKETFPFVTNEKEIYFSSDGRPGLGGLDVYVGEIEDDGTISEIQNIGADVNSPKDDFAYMIDPVSRKGYFSSNKAGGQGSDDIYKFLETRKLQCIQELNGIITDAESGIILPRTKVTLYENQVVKNTILSDAAGFYIFPVECGKTYNVRAEKVDYATKEVSITIEKLSGKTSLPIALDKSKCKVTIGDDLGKCFGIKMIYFDLDKSNIRTEAAIDLEKILDVLDSHPTMKLDIRSHTDSRQTYKYNEALSNRRAKSTIDWLVKNGIDPGRLTGKGFGEKQLVNECSDNVKCTEEQHQANRRSEFIITAL